MMRAVLDFALERGADAQFSLERHFYCTSGVCGFCDAGGLRACVEGPVFTAARLAGVAEFGSRRRDATGVWRPL
jgi:NAD(P)H-flavin reductase